MGTAELSQYCREVENYLTRVNSGHLVRIVGPGFELVRQWAEEEIPLSVVFRGIELKADRHKQRQSRHPLRIEFCEADVREVFDGWRRAVGLPQNRDVVDEAAQAEPARKRASVTKHVDRAIERLSRVSGRMDLSERFLVTAGIVLEELGRIRDVAKGARGHARDEFASQLQALDQQLLAAARDAAPADLLRSLTENAGADLAAFRQRLSAEAWDQAIAVTVDRLLRDHYGLPAIGV